MVSKMIINVAVLCVLGLAHGKNFGLNVEEDVNIQGVHKSHPGLFNAKWRQIYDEEHLNRQPKFRMAAEQPKKELNYEVREYEAAWYVSSYKPCLNQTESAAEGFLRLASYMSGNNKEMRRFPLTYPIISEIELGVKDVAEVIDEITVTPNKRQQIDDPIRHLYGSEEATLKPEKKVRKSSKEVKPVRKTCVDAFSQHLYLPIETTTIPPTTDDVTIQTEIVPTKKYYVRLYHDVFSKDSQARCNLEAGKFALDLALSGAKINRRVYYCAMYEPGKADATALFEVLFEDESVIV